MNAVKLRMMLGGVFLAGLAGFPFSSLCKSVLSGGEFAIEAGTGRLVPLSGKALNVFAADPKVAEVRPASASSLFVFGVAPGHTTVAAISDAGKVVGQYTIDVMPSSAAATATSRMLRGTAADGIAITPGQDNLTLSGEASSPLAVDQAVAASGSTLDKAGLVFDRAHLPGSIQVNLRVRIAEMSRTLTRALGINWQSVGTLGANAAFGVASAAPIATALATTPSVASIASQFKAGGSMVALDAVIDALAQDQLVRLLAEPNLTTMSGEPASFLVGGEFPIPVATADNNVTLDFKQYGVSLSFVPTVMSDGAISLHVRPEVSELTDQGSVSLTESNSTIKIPGLIVRRADTTVELGSGQSFAIAGLLQDETTMTGAGLPFLGDLPVLGALFRSDSFQRAQTELVIVVTPYIVRPSENVAALQLPTDNWTAPNDLERILLLRQSGRLPTGKSDAGASHIPGDAGFLVE